MAVRHVTPIDFFLPTGGLENSPPPPREELNPPLAVFSHQINTTGSSGVTPELPQCEREENQS